MTEYTIHTLILSLVLLNVKQLLILEANYILQFSRFRGFWKNSLHQMTKLEMLNMYFVKQSLVYRGD